MMYEKSVEDIADWVMNYLSVSGTVDKRSLLDKLSDFSRAQHLSGWLAGMDRAATLFLLDDQKVGLKIAAIITAEKNAHKKSALEEK